MNWNTEFSPLELSSQSSLPDLMLAPLPSWGTIVMSGPDKKSYLQGQVTCNVVSLAEDQSTLGAHCDAKGKMWSIFRLFHHHDTYALFQAKSAIAEELAQLKKYAVFSKVEIGEGSDMCFGIMGNQTQHFIEKLTATEQGDVRSFTGGTAVKVSEKRWLLLIHPDFAPQLLAEFSGTQCTEAQWRWYDIQEAQPTLEQSEQQTHIPQAFNLQAVGGISFTKGCYTGQETVARAKYRGINKRAMFRVSGQRENAEHITLERSVGENWRSAGSLLSDFQYSDGMATGLIILPNDLEVDTQLRLCDEPGHIWTIEPLPYSLDDA